MDQFSYLGNSEVGTIDELYQQYLQDPHSVDKSFHDFFKGFDFALKRFSSSFSGWIDKEFHVINLIHGYLQRGHLFTKTNPVRARRKYFPTLDLQNFGLSEDDLHNVFQAGNEVGIGPAKLSDIIQRLENTYCQSIGGEYLYIRKPEMVEWLKMKMESVENTPSFSTDKKMGIYHSLKQA